MSPQKTSPKNVRIIVLVTRDEQKTLKLAAKRQGVSLGELARIAFREARILDVETKAERIAREGK